MNQTLLKSTYKLKIVNYFDDLKNKIDLLVEIFISDNQHDPAAINEINKAREEWIKETDECQAHNLAELEKNENIDELITDEQLFKRFCFLVCSNADLQTTGCFTGRFISTDVYLRPGQIECFQELLKFTSSGNKYLDEQAMDKEQLESSLQQIFVDVKLYDDVRGYSFDMNYSGHHLTVS
jgi:hypothetical protein